MPSKPNPIRTALWTTVFACPETCLKCGGHGPTRRNGSSSRLATTRGYRYRRRRCVQCGETWSTFESVIVPWRVRVSRRSGDL